MSSMILSSPNINIKLASEIDDNCLLFEFNGKFTERASIDGTRAWADYMDKNEGQFIFIWDCTNMDGFEMNARKKWYETMKLYSHRIIFIHVVANNIIIRSAAKVMLNFFGLKGVIVRTMEELRAKV
jgi:hypothetical protein